MSLEEFRKFCTIQGKNNFQSPFSYINHSLHLQGQRKRIFSEQPVELMCKSYDWLKCLDETFLAPKMNM